MLLLPSLPDAGRHREALSFRLTAYRKTVPDSILRHSFTIRMWRERVTGSDDE